LAGARDMSVGEAVGPPSVRWQGRADLRAAA
jgi:hypothetical protein